MMTDERGVFAALSHPQGPNSEAHVDRTFRGGPGLNDFQLKVLTNRHADYASLKDQFLKKWEKAVEALTVQRIFKVQVEAVRCLDKAMGTCGQEWCFTTLLFRM